MGGRARVAALLIFVLLTVDCARAESRPATSMQIERQVSVVSCIIDGAKADDPKRSFTLELSREKTTLSALVPQASTVEALQAALEWSQSPTSLSYTIGSWRIIHPSDAGDGLFNESTRRICVDGCALHETIGIDTRKWVFVASKSSGTRVEVDWDLKGVERQYANARYGVLQWIGYTRPFSYVLRDTNDRAGEKISCNFSEKS